MKHLLLTTIAAVLVVGCGESQQSAPPEAQPAEPVAEVPAQPSSPQVEAELTEPVAEAAKPEPPTVKVPEISLHDAAEGGNIEAVKQHLAAGTDVNAVDEYGRTPLLMAVRGIGSIFAPVDAPPSPVEKEIIELLIAKGADVNTNNAVGGTPLDYADNPELAELLRNHGGKSGVELSIHVASWMGNIEAVKQHIAAGVDVNANYDGVGTPLHGAAGVGNNEIAELLIAKGADVNAKYEVSGTPLDNAEHYPETAALLRKHGGKTAEELKAEGK